MDSTLARTLSFTFILGFAWNPPPASAAPKDVVLALDNSHSMSRVDPDFLVRSAARKFVQGLGGDDRTAILVFRREASLLMPLTLLDETSRAEVLRTLDRVDYDGSPAESPGAIQRAIYEIRLHGRSEADRSVVVVTGGTLGNGRESFSERRSKGLADELVVEAVKHKIRIFAVAFSDAGDAASLRSLSEQSSGEYFRAETATEMAGIFRRITEKLAATRMTAGGPASAPVRAKAQTAPTVLPEPAPLPVPELPDAASLFLDPPARPVPPQANASNRTVAPPVTDHIGATQRPALPTLPRAKTTFKRSADPQPVRGPADPAESSATMAPATEPAGPPGAHARLQTMPRAPGAGRREAAPASAWLAAVLAAALLGVAWTMRASLPWRRQTGDGTKFEDQLPKAFLNDLGGISEKPSYELGESLTVVGRNNGGDDGEINYVVIPEPTVGRRHALIEFRNHCFWVADQNSLNGTFINGERIEGDAPLKHGDRVRFHRHEFEFLLLDMFESDCTRPGETGSSRFSRGADGDGQGPAPAAKDAARAAFR